LKYNIKTFVKISHKWYNTVIIINSILYMIKYIIFILLLLFVTWCWKEEIINGVEKKDFVINVKDISEFWKNTNLSKVGTLKSSQNIKISSNAIGRVMWIYVKEGDSVKKWEILARLDDNIANYQINLERANNALKKAKLNYSKLKNSLNKGVYDLNVNIDNLKIDWNNSSSSLQLEKIDNSIKKINIDYENLKISNSQTKIWFNSSLAKELNSYKNLTSDLIRFSDELLSVTEKNLYTNVNIKNYLWAKDTNQKKESEKLLRDLIKYNINPYSWAVSIDNLEENLKFITIWYSKSTILLNSIERTLDNSISSVGSFSANDIALDKTLVNWYQSSITIKNSGFIALKNSINKFLDTYKNNEKSLLKQIEVLKSDRKIYIKSLDTNIILSESTILEANTNRDLSLSTANRLIIDAQISYKEALKQYKKLTIKSPISWIINKVFIDLWQEVNNWVALFDISGNSNNEVSISFNKSELKYVYENMKVNLNYNNKNIEWYIYSISKVADSNLKYSSKIRFNQKINLTWNIVSINILVKVKYQLLPIDIIKIKDNNIWTINILKNWKIEKKDIFLWKIYNDKIEVKDTFSGSLKVITNFVDNFDSEKFNLKIK